MVLIFALWHLLRRDTQAYILNFDYNLHSFHLDAIYSHVQVFCLLLSSTAHVVICRITSPHADDVV